VDADRARHDHRPVEAPAARPARDGGTRAPAHHAIRRKPRAHGVRAVSGEAVGTGNWKRETGNGAANSDQRERSRHSGLPFSLCLLPLRQAFQLRAKKLMAAMPARPAIGYASTLGHRNPTTVMASTATAIVASEPASCGPSTR